MRTLLVIACLLLSVGTAQAQIVNTQPLLAHLDGEGFSGELGTSLEWRTGNVELLRLSASLLLVWRGCGHAVLSSSNLEVGEKSGERFLLRTFSHLRYQYSVDELITLEAYGQVAHDEFRRITLRALAGAGARWSLLSTERTRLRLGTAWMVESERFAQSETYEDSGTERLNHRASFYLDLKHDLSDRLAFGVTTYYQPRIVDWSDWQLSADATLAISLTKSLALTLQLTLAYDATPPNGIETLDTATLFGVTWAL